MTRSGWQRCRSILQTNVCNMSNVNTIMLLFFFLTERLATRPDRHSHQRVVTMKKLRKVFGKLMKSRKLTILTNFKFCNLLKMEL